MFYVHSFPSSTNNKTFQWWKSWSCWSWELGLSYIGTSNTQSHRTFTVFTGTADRRAPSFHLRTFVSVNIFVAQVAESTRFQSIINSSTRIVSRQSSPSTMSGKKEQESQQYWDADFLTRFGPDGRSKTKFVTVDGEYLHGYLQAPVAPGLYPAGVLEDKPAMSGDYGPKRAAATTSSAKSTAGPGPKPAASGPGGSRKSSK